MLAGCSENGKSLFNIKEIRWFRFNYYFWLKMIKGTKKGNHGRRVFMKFYKYGKNVYQVSRELKLGRSNVYHWVDEFRDTFLLKTIPLNDKNTNEHMMVLDQKDFPLLIPLTTIYIKQQVANENF